MNPTIPVNVESTWSRVLIILGNVAMLIGAVDPMEGSLVILPGSGLVALGTFLGHSERRLIAYRVGVFLLIAIGVSAMLGLSSVGGVGGNSGRSMWWGVLVLPYLLGWSMGIWGPKSPRWLLLLGVVVSLWYLAILVMILHPAGGSRGPKSVLPALILGATGMLTIGGCILRWLRPSAARA